MKKRIKLKLTQKPTSDGELELKKAPRDGTLMLELDDKCENDAESIAAISKALPNLNKLVAVDLSECDLCELPFVFHVLKLKQLNLAGNCMLSVPRCLREGLAELEDLNLSGNKLRIFESRLKCWKQLKKLQINECGVSELPVWLIGCPNLRELSCAGNAIRSTIMLRNCEYLNLHDCQIDDTNAMKQCNLIDLDIGGNTRIDLNDLLSKAKWTETIKIVKLGNLLFSKFPAEITLMVNLEELHLNDNCLFVLPNEILKLTSLRVLNVENNEIYSIPDIICLMQNLQVFRATDNHLTFANFANMPRLKYLDLYNNDLNVILIDDSDELEFVDFEKNYMNHSDMVTNYQNKRDALRANLHESRFLHVKSLIPRAVLASERSTSEDDSSEGLECNVWRSSEEELWDIPVSLVTFSDDEFTGRNTPSPISNNLEQKENNDDDGNCFADAD